MIFKTFDSDIDNATSKIGVFGKSFDDIIKLYQKRKAKITKLENNGYEKPEAKNQVGGLFSYIFKDNSKGKLVEEFETFKSMMTDYGMTVEEVAKDLGDQLSPEIQSYVKSAKNGELTTEGFNKSIGNLSLGAKAASMALEGLKYVGNMLASIALSAVISLAIKGLNNLVHAADNAKKSAEGFSSSFKSMNEEFTSNDGKLSDLQKQYNELSKGVDSLGKNVSLTTEDYDTYKQVVSEISDMMPDMLARYDEEGNKIGFVQGKLKNLSAEYDNYKKKRAVDLVNGKNDNGDSVKDVFNNYQYQTAHVNEDSNVVGKRKIFGTSNYEKILSLQAEINNEYDGIFGKHKLTNEDIEKKTALIQKYQSEIDSSVSAIQNAISAIAQSGDAYYQLSDKEQQFLDRYISSLSQSAIESKGLNDETTARTFINNLINDIKSGKPEIMDAYNDLFSFDIDKTELSPEEIKEKIDSLIQQLAKALGEDNWQDLKIRLGFEFVDDNAKDYEDTFNRFKSSEESNLDELTQKYDEAIAKRKELYSGENYVGNVDINNRPVVINDDGSYSTTSTAFQEKWVGDEENGHYIIAHFTPILPDGTVLDDETLNDYIDRILNSDNPMEADKVENGGYGILYKVDTEINGQKITDDNLEDAFGVADAWDVDMHNLQNEMYASEAEIKAQIERFKDDVGGIDGSQKVKDFFNTEGINTKDELKQFNEITKDITDADLAIQKWNKHKEEAIETSAPFDDPTDLLRDSIDKDRKDSRINLADLKDRADIIKSLQSEIAKTGNIGVDSMQKIIKQFPEAKQYLADYMSGLITEQELFSKLEDVYAEDTQQYINSLVKKNETDVDFFTNVKNNNETLFNALAENYRFDIKSWNNLAKAKLDVDKQLMAELASIWTGYYTAQKDSVTGLYTLVTNPEFDVQDDSDLVTPEMEEARVKQMAVYDKYNQIIQSLNDAAGSFAKANIDLDWNVLGKDDSSSSSSSSKDTKEKLNWIERLIKRISTAYSRLKNVVSDTTTTWLKRNNALSDSISTLSSEINAQSQAYEYYMNAFNGYGLDDYYKNQIANGSISIDVIYDEDLKNAISDCQDFYDKAQDAKTAVQELGIELKGLAKSKFDNLKSQYEEQINQITKTNDLLQKEADIIDTKGWFASTLLNNSFIEQEQKNLNKLKEERTALVNALNSAIDSGKIEEYSEDWYDMQSSIDDCTSSILDAEKALIEYDNAIRQINWDAFDRTRDDVEDLINETDFLVELLKDVGITDDNGNMTKEGQAAQALLAQKYQLYLNQAKAYKDEISKINEDLVNDPYDKELLDRKQDLIDKEQDAIKSAMSEKDAIKDLTNDAYTDFIDKLRDAIDKYKELMDTMKDAYDYEKSIREKTEALNALEKQYSAYQGDNSEEGKKNIQQLKDQINTAKDDLKDTEYEKLINDTEKILDQLQSDTQEWINRRLDDLDNLIQDIIEQSNENASDISQTITSTAENYGYNLSKPLLFSAKNVNYGKFN